MEHASSLDTGTVEVVLLSTALSTVVTVTKETTNHGNRNSTYRMLQTKQG